MNIEYAIYCRKSSDEKTKQAQSIPDQIEKCLEYAEKEGLKIMNKPKEFSDFESPRDLYYENNDSDLHSRRIYESTKNMFIIKESHSAKKPGGRPKRTKLIEWVNKGKVKGILSYSPDRQSRNMIDGGEIIEMADDGLVDLKYTNFHFINNASGRMMLGFRFVFSKQYSDKLSEDIGRGNETTVNKGKSLGKYKYGYFRDDNTGLYKPHKIYRELMKRAFEMKLYEKRSDKYIANWLNNNGYVREYKTKDETSKVNPKRLGNVWIDPFYYGVFISGQSLVDMRDKGLNPYYEPLINQSEHELLQKKHDDQNAYATPQKRNEKYDTITPYDEGLVITEDGYAITPYLPNPKRFNNKLEELKLKNPNVNLSNVVKSNQLRCKCSALNSKFNKLDIHYSLIENAIIKLFSKLRISDSDYENYKNYLNREIDNKNKLNILKNNKIQLNINNIKSKRNEYIKKNMHLKRDKEEEKIYQEAKLQFDNQLDSLRRQALELDLSERELLLECEVFIKILRKAPEYFHKASYVQQRKIINLTISNIMITKEKQVKINVLPGLEGLFDLNFSKSGDGGTRTLV